MELIETIIIKPLLGLVRLFVLPWFGRCTATYPDEEDFVINLTGSPLLTTINGRTGLFADTVEQKPASLHMLYMGTNSILISDNTTSLLIDPYFTRPHLRSADMPLCHSINLTPNREIIRKTLDGAGIDNLDAVLTTHSHFDHALDIAEVINYLPGSPVLYGSQSTRYIGLGGGVPEDQIVTIEQLQSYSIGRFTVQFILTEHLPIPFVTEKIMGTIRTPVTPPADLFSYKDGGTYAIYITHDEGRMLNIGSANYRYGAFDFLHNRVDHLILGIAGFDNTAIAVFDHITYKRDVYNGIVTSTNPGQILFSHWDDYYQPLNNITSCTGSPTESYDYFVQQNESLVPKFLPIGGYIQLARLE